METRARDVISSLEIGIDEVRMIGIKGMGGAGKTTTARAVFDLLSADFEANSFVGNVREVSNASMFGLKKLQEQVLSKVLNERVTLDSVNDGKNIMKRRMCGKKVLLVLDDVDHMEQLKALAGEPKWFKPGSRILITTRDEQVLVAHRVDVIRDSVLLSEKEAISLFSRYAFGRENPVQGYEELSGKVVRYAAGLPLTLEVLGSFLCGKDKLEWVDAIHRLEKIPLKDTKKIEYLPDSICMLKSLKLLNVAWCWRLGKLPEDIGRLESLERLDLSSTEIKHLPDSICMLKHLKYLYLEDCDLLEKLPEDLGRLECLEEIVITHTGISHLPQSIFGLKGLCIYASTELLKLYDFPSEIKTRAC